QSHANAAIHGGAHRHGRPAALRRKAPRREVNSLVMWGRPLWSAKCGADLYGRPNVGPTFMVGQMWGRPLWSARCGADLYGRPNVGPTLMVGQMWGRPLWSAKCGA